MAMAPVETQFLRTLARERRNKQQLINQQPHKKRDALRVFKTSFRVVLVNSVSPLTD
jgi:hypothetical protein